MDWLLHSVVFSPHGLPARDPFLAGLQSVSDAIAATAYLSIPIALAVLVRRRRDMEFGWVFWLFASFAALCGMSSVLEAITVWDQGWERFSGVVKFLEAVVSLSAAAVVWPLLPMGARIPSERDMVEVNQKLESEAVGRRESEARYRFLYHRTPTPLHVIAPDGTLECVSDFWLELLGREREEVVGRPLSDFYVPGQEEAFAQGLRSLSEGHELRNVERRMLRSDGSVISVLVSAAPEFGPDGRVLRHLCVVLDVTERDRAQEDLRSSERRLVAAQKLEAIGRLTGGVAHDFNNMLAVITGGLESMRSKLPSDRPDIRRLADSCLEAAFRSAKLVAQLLSFARRQTLEPASLDPVEVVDGIRVLFERTVGESVSLALPIPDDDAWSCLADRSHLESALLNLVVNARDAVGTSGSVRVSISRLSATADRLPGAQDVLPSGDYVAIRISDDGAGMSVEARRRALEPFFTTKPMGRGTGLGLSQVYGFTRQSGGTIAIETEEGRGTTVSLILPRAPAPPEPGAEVDDAEDAWATSGETILLVEDEPGILLVAEDILTGLGYQVRAVTEARTALAALADGFRPGLLLTDIQMPGGMDGVELALRARGMMADLPVLLCSGNDGGPDSRSRSVPGAGLLRKPYRRAQMARAVREALDIARKRQGR